MTSQAEFHSRKPHAGRVTPRDLIYLEPMRFDGMHEAYPYLADQILGQGHQSSPRGEATTEVLGASFVIEDAVNFGVPLGCGRKVGKKMMAIDGSGNLAGASFPDVAIAVAPVLARFADTLEESEHLTKNVIASSNVQAGEPFLQGSYGPRIGKQLERVETQLRRDPDTRQAVVNLWRAEDADPFWKDRPCTTQFQLMIRGGKLEMFVSMRANDLWTGTCYDVFQFGQIQAAMAHVLGIQPGPYHHYATSLHIYDRDITKFDNVSYWPSATRQFVNNSREEWGPDWPELSDKPHAGGYSCWAEVRERFTAMLAELRLQLDPPPIAVYSPPFEPRNEVEQWYWDILSQAIESAQKEAGK
jgi:hypothetical protein